MRFLLDENFPKAAIGILVELGHDVVDFRGTPDEGMEDQKVFEKAQSLGAILLTTDRDFFHTIPILFPRHAGIIVVALRQPNRAGIISRLKAILERIPEEAFRDRAFQLRDTTWLAFPPLDQSL
ncbi:DUF5615 family PIN-like protein [Luteolibacter sp. GHJ8]|jgi:predicted nuclease of predicted toxin-antitoxin system|uniref:DUF5615 family PIN-like protein n=1 Tax=Luteolibacter rhizosphaerae TaxID=2989719 RepID=A0ABT3FY33_9BACT|nr:DUF5615 family PIN-like protein [Luteolibacter rhizosphaerae]